MVAVKDDPLIVLFVLFSKFLIFFHFVLIIWHFSIKKNRNEKYRNKTMQYDWIEMSKPQERLRYIGCGHQASTIYLHSIQIPIFMFFPLKLLFFLAILIIIIIINVPYHFSIIKYSLLKTNKQHAKQRQIKQRTVHTARHMTVQISKKKRFSIRKMNKCE